MELKEEISTPIGVSFEISIPDTVTDSGSVPHAMGHRRRENEWRRKHQDVLRAFEGQWVVLDGEEIVAHGANPAELVETFLGKANAS